MRGLGSTRIAAPAIDLSTTSTPDLSSRLPSASVLAGKREERIRKAFSADRRGPGDAREGQHEFTALRRENRRCEYERVHTIVL